MNISFSVAIVTWNRPEQLNRAVYSILKQVVLPIEVIIVDNASTASLEEHVEKYKKMFDEKGIIFNFIRLHKNIGCPPARNIAFANCHGDYIYSLDDDGYLDKNALFELSEFIISNKCKPVVLSSRIVTPEGDTIGFNFDGIVKRNFFSAGASAFLREYIHNGNYFPDYFRQMEESNLAFKIWNDDRDIYFVSSSIMYHDKITKGRAKLLECRFNYKHDILNISSHVNVIPSIFIFMYKSKSHLVSYLKVEKKGFFTFIMDFLWCIPKILFSRRILNAGFLDYYRFSRNKSKN